MADTNPAPAPISTTSTTTTDIQHPISPVAATHTARFPHHTSPSAAPKKPFIETSTPSINAQPVELDGTSTSPETLSRRSTDGRRSEERMFSPDMDDEVMEELSGVTGEGTREREKRAAMLASRSRDPAVLVDIPQDPNADEVAAANTIAGQVTPALPSGEMDGVVESVEGKDKS